MVARWNGDGLVEKAAGSDRERERDQGINVVFSGQNFVCAHRCRGGTEWMPGLCVETGVVRGGLAAEI